MALLAISLCGCANNLLEDKTPRDRWKVDYDQAYVHEEKKDFSRALTSYREALKKLGKSEKYIEDRAKTMVSLASVLLEEGQYEEAKSIIKEAEPVCHKLWKPNRGGELNRQSALLYARILTLKAKTQLKDKSYKEALSTINSAYAKSRSMLAPDHSIHQILMIKAKILDGSGEHEKANSVRESASFIAAPLHYKDPSLREKKSPAALCNAAREAIESMRFAEADSCISIYLPDLEKEPKQEQYGLLGESYLIKGNLREREKKWEEAESDFKKAARYLSLTQGAVEKKLMFDAYEKLIKLHFNQKRPEQAEALAKKTIELNSRIKHTGGRKRTESKIMEILAYGYIKTNRLEKAEECLKRRLFLEGSLNNRENKRYSRTLEELAELYDKMNKAEEAKSSYEKAIKLREKETNVNPVFLQESHEAYAKFLSRHGYEKEAQAQRKKAIMLKNSIIGPTD